MRNKILISLLAMLGLLSNLESQLQAVPLGTAFTYQGKLTDGGALANGMYDIRVTVYDSLVGSNTVAGPLTNSAVGVTNGLFTVTLDFGSGVFSGDARWLELAVRASAGGAFIALAPRQPLTASPYALFAPDAGTATSVADGAVAAGGIASGQVVKSLNALHDTVTLSAGTNINVVAVGNDIRISATPGTVVTNAGWSLTGNGGNSPSYFLGTTDGQPLELRVNGARALRLVPTSDTPNLIGGYSGNSVAAGLAGATIGGGGTVLGAQPNVITNNGQYGTIAGGYHNTVTNYGGAVLGGSVHLAGGWLAGVGAGQGHTNLSDYAWIGGGQYNLIQGGADYSTTGGGIQNSIQAGARYSSIAGGSLNVIGTNALYAAIAGGRLGNIGAGSGQSTIAGGYGQTIGANAASSVMSGGYQNSIGANAPQSTVAGGAQNTVSTGAAGAVISGGTYNSVDLWASNSVVVGGSGNEVGSSWACIAGGSTNTLLGAYSTMGGGGGNVIASATYSVLGGGRANRVGSFGDCVVLGGGQSNWVWAANQAFLGGGLQNYVLSNAYQAVLAGGYDNQVGAGAYLGTLSGGTHNRVGAPGGTVPGGNGNGANGINSFAAGTQAQAQHDGAFVWADAQYTNFTSTAPNQFILRVHGGVGINNNAPQQDLSVAGGMNIDQANLNSGTTANILSFGSASGEGIGSKRSGPNGFGLDFYTGSANRMTIANNGYVGIGTNAPVSPLHVNGEATVNVLTILGGSDVAEPFELSTPEVPEGSVVVIDPEHPGQLKLSNRAYDTRVAGVVSGANGVRPGLSLRQAGALGGGRNVALTGRVYVQAEAASRPIQPGDLLTTSDTPGFAMKVADHARAQGATLGKAMTGLPQGKGLVLVLVTLQ